MILNISFFLTFMYIALFPLFYILTKRFMGLNTMINAFNAGILSCACLILALISSYFCFYLHQWFSFSLNFDHICMIFNPTIALSLLSLGLCCILVMVSFNSVRVEEYLVFLYTILFVICVVSSFDFISIFVVLECVNVCTYVILASSSHNLLSIYSSLVYVIVTISSTCFLLIGITLLYLEYSQFNLTYFPILFRVEKLGNLDKVTILGITCVFVSLVIKLGVFPFYKWLIDVYTGFEIKSTLFISTILKMSSLIVLINLIQSLAYVTSFIYFFQLAGLISMVIGGYGAMFEWKFNRFIALAGLFSMGTVFLVIPLNYYVIDMVIFGYMIIYNISIVYLVIFFGAYGEHSIFLVSQLNMYNIDQTVSAGYLTNMFSIINLPPFAGFFPKLLIAYCLYFNNQFVLVLLVLVISLLSGAFFVKLYLIYFTKSSSLKIQVIKKLNLLRYCSILVILVNIVVFLCSILFIINIET